MGALRDFVADVLETQGAAVEPVEPDGLDILAPTPLRSAMGWPELARLGFGTAQGSSSRGGLRGLVVMARRIREGVDCAFTIDGPRGPRYVAKVGPVLLARMTGAPIMVFHFGVDRGKTFEKTWDRFLLPSLFARAVMVGAPPIYVPQDADAEMIKAKHAEMQKELERVRDIAEGWYSFTEEERERYRREIGP